MPPDAYVKYQRPSSDQSKVMTKVKVFVEKRTDGRTDGKGQISWCHLKGLITRDTHVKYQRPSTDSIETIAKVKVFGKGSLCQGQGHKVK